jgi:hypothetical protein
MRKYRRDKFGGVHHDEMIVGAKKSKSLLNEGWEIHRTEYFAISSFADWWGKFSLGNKVTTIAIVVGIVTQFTIFGLNRHFDSKYDNLKVGYDTLSADYIQLNQSYILTVDTLSVLRQMIDSKAELLKQDKLSDKKSFD